MIQTLDLTNDFYKNFKITAIIFEKKFCCFQNKVSKTSIFFQFLRKHFPNFYLIRGLDPTNHSPGEIVQVGFDLNFHRHNNGWVLRFLDNIDIDPNIAEQRRGAIVKCSDLKLIIISHIVFEFGGRSQSAILHN